MFQKGKSGNPGGRPRSIARQVRDAIGNDLAALHQAQIMIAKGQHPLTGEAVQARECTAAYIALLDRGYGKPVAAVHVETSKAGGGVELPLEIRAMDDSALESLQQSLEAAAAVLDEADSADADDEG